MQINVPWPWARVFAKSGSGVASACPSVNVIFGWMAAIPPLVSNRGSGVRTWFSEGRSSLLIL